MTRETMMTAVWDSTWFGSTKTLDVHVAALRNELGDALSLECAHRVHRSVLIIAVSLALAMPLFLLSGQRAVGGAMLLIVWGLTYGGVSVGLQTWMIKAVPQAVEAASSLWVAVFTLSIGLGALAGGVIVDTLTLQGVLWLGGACALIAALAVWSARTNENLR
ncbi:winged helix-turn-helix domain-containing protein [Streptomyces canus]|uniref:winged helix-turn-helix domain-containing protein n=1 Tax=Streptomyces canus TaxID=58343 RepID=UPI0027D7D2E0|nr:winged helix-turn-helix domain-containing protein [Streptomyces canus]